MTKREKRIRAGLKHPKGWSWGTCAGLMRKKPQDLVDFDKIRTESILKGRLSKSNHNPTSFASKQTKERAGIPSKRKKIRDTYKQETFKVGNKITKIPGLKMPSFREKGQTYVRLTPLQKVKNGLAKKLPGY
jgi:hypothetical protein